MKNILHLFVLIPLVAFILWVGQLDLMPAYTFWVCFALSLICFFATIAYFVFVKKQKLFVLAFILLSATVALVGYPTFAATNTQEGSISQMRSDIKNWGPKIDDTYLKSYKSNTDYGGLTGGDQYDPENLELANAIIQRCMRLEIMSKPTDELYEYCEDAQKYATMAGNVTQTQKQQCSTIMLVIKKLIQNDDCWPCDITQYAIGSVMNVAKGAFPVLSKVALTLLCVFFLFWLLFVTLVFFGKFGFARISEYLTNVLNKTILVLIIAALLANTNAFSTLYQMTVSPIVSYGASLSRELSEAGYRGVKSEGGVIRMIQRIASFGKNPKSKCKRYCNKTYSGIGATDSTFLSPEAQDSILCMICNTYNEVAPIITFGQTVSCFAMEISSSKSEKSFALSRYAADAMPRVGGLVVGLFITILFSFIMILIAFYSISAVLELGFVLIFLPLWLICFVFKPTREYTKNAFTLMMDATVLMIALSLAVALVMIGWASLMTNHMTAAIAVAIIQESPNKLLDMATGASDINSLSDMIGGGEGSFVDGLVDTAINFGIQQLEEAFLGVSPITAMMIMVSFSFLSVSLINSSPELVERILDLWLGKSLDVQAVMMEGASKAVRSAKASIDVSTSGVMAAKEGITSLKAKQEQKKNSSATSARTPNQFPQRQDPGGSS